jgi:hypothetical protein
MFTVATPYLLDYFTAKSNSQSVRNHINRVLKCLNFPKLVPPHECKKRLLEMQSISPFMKGIENGY